MRQRIRATSGAVAMGAILGAALVASIVTAASSPDRAMPVPAHADRSTSMAVSGFDDGSNAGRAMSRHRSMASYRPRVAFQVSGPYVARRTPAAAPVRSAGRHRPVVSARSLLRRLTVHSETPKGYHRSKFRLWISQGHGCDTRAVVLKDESSTRTTQNRYCTVDSGTWKSQYDGRTVRHAGELDIDHRVPLDEAWRSGAKKWTASTRTAYANDLGYPQSLVAVTAHANRSKGDRDVAGWLPPKSVCHYVTRWIAVKYRWSLTVNRAEASVLRSKLSSCGTAASRVTRPARATVHTTA